MCHSLCELGVEDLKVSFWRCTLRDQHGDQAVKCFAQGFGASQNPGGRFRAHVGFGYERGALCLAQHSAQLCPIHEDSVRGTLRMKRAPYGLTGLS